MKVGDKVFVVSKGLYIFETRVQAINYGSSPKYSLCFGSNYIGEIYASNTAAKAYRDNFIVNAISDLYEYIEHKEKYKQSWFARLFCGNSTQDKVKQVEIPSERLYIGDILYTPDHCEDGYIEEYCIDKVKDVGNRYFYYLRETKYSYIYDSCYTCVKSDEINKNNGFYTSKLLAYKALVKKLTALQEKFSKEPYGIWRLNRYGF